MIIKSPNNGSIQDIEKWDTVERKCDHILLSCPRFLLVWHDVGVSVGKNTFQHHSLDILVLMAQQLWTDTSIFYVCTPKFKMSKHSYDKTCDL